MKTFVAAFVVAVVVGAALTPLARRLAVRFGAVSVPGGRHVHERSIPRLGGLAIFGAFFAPLAAFFVVESAVAEAFTRDSRRALGLAVGGTILCLVGVVDDTRGLRAAHKLWAQVAVGVLAFYCGFRIDAVALPIVGALPMGIFALPVTVLWVVGIVNAVNLIDGLDGLAAGVVFFAGLTNFIIAFISGSALVALLMAAMMGAVIGFLFHNFNPARIFMGDSGSYFLGFVLAATSLAGAPKASTAVSLLVPVVALGVPIFDTLFAMVRRFLERRSIFSPDRGHIHHRLLDMGVTHRRAVLIIYGVSIVFTVSAIAISLGRDWQIGVALLAASVALVGLVRFVGYFEYLHARRRQKTRLRSEDIERLRRALPDFNHTVAAARSEQDVLDALGTVRDQAGLTSVQVIQAGGVVRECGHCAPASVPREAISARFPIGRDGSAVADVKFVWSCDDPDVSPQMDILLQIVTDMVAVHLRRVHSPLVPRPTFEPNEPVLVGEATLEARQSSY